MANLPKEPDSYTSLLDLAVNVLDPVIEYFWIIKLTYGFCSPELAKLISGRIAPDLDQHLAHEKKRGGKYVCERLGAAVDFIVDDEDMFDVADWIIQHLPFDRIYIYEANRPIHVSFGPNQARLAYLMVISKTGHRHPRSYRQAQASLISPSKS